jgi:hypothetical protein
MCLSTRAQALLDAVIARHGKCPEYAAAERKAFDADVFAVKRAVDTSGLVSQVVFVRLLVQAASAWAMKTFGRPTVPLPQNFAVKVLKGAPGRAYNAQTVRLCMAYGAVLMEIERRIAAGRTDPRRMPTSIQYLMFAPFKQLSMDDKMAVIEAVELPFVKGSVKKAYLSLYKDKVPPAEPGPHAVYDAVRAAAKELGHRLDLAFFASYDFKSALNAYNGVYPEIDDMEEEMEVA